MSVTLRLSAHGVTDIGRRRSVNEDSILCAYPSFLVADGMGGHEAGDRASAAAVAAFAPLAGRDDVDPEEVVDCVLSAHDAVRGLRSDAQRPAGTTLSGMVVTRQAGQAVWTILNVGDSRVYRLAAGTLEQLTVDHSAVQEHREAAAAGQLVSAVPPSKNVITRALGAEVSAADYWLLPVRTGDRLLVCSDGLTGELSDDDVSAALTLASDASAAAEALVQLAVARGGRDNVSVVVVDVEAGGVPPELDESTLSPEADWADTNTIEIPGRIRG